MNVGKEIIAEAQRLFDVVGVTPYGGDSLLVLGLVTTPKRDLDDFLRDEGSLCFPANQYPSGGRGPFQD